MYSVQNVEIEEEIIEMKKMLKTPVALGIVLVVLNIIFFAIPIHKTAVFWLSDFAVIVAVIAQVPIANMAFKDNSSLTSKVYGCFIINVELRYLAVLIVCAFVFIVLSENNSHFPMWIPVVVYAVIYGLAAVGLIASDSVRDFVETQDEKLKDCTMYMRKLYAEASALKKSISDREIINILSEVVEKIRFSDPVSCRETFEQEKIMYQTFECLKKAVESGNIEKVKNISEKFIQLLSVRNSICKYSK